jgi:hypothetical protein
MRYLTTPHWRLINLVMLLLLMGAGLNAFVLEPPVLPAYKDHILFAAFVITAAAVLLVKPTADVGRLRVPALSRLQLRVVTGVLFLAWVLSLANYHLLDPGFFAPYKRQVSVAMFTVALIFVHLYEPQLAELAQKESVRGDGDA